MCKLCKKQFEILDFIRVIPNDVYTKGVCTKCKLFK